MNNIVTAALTTAFPNGITTNEYYMLPDVLNKINDFVAALSHNNTVVTATITSPKIKNVSHTRSARYEGKYGIVSNEMWTTPLTIRKIQALVNCGQDVAIRIMARIKKNYDVYAKPNRNGTEYIITGYKSLTAKDTDTVIKLLKCGPTTYTTIASSVTQYKQQDLYVSSLINKLIHRGHKIIKNGDTYTLAA